MDAVHRRTLHIAHVLAKSSPPRYTAHVPTMLASCTARTPGPLSFHLAAEPSARGTNFADRMTSAFARHGPVRWYFAGAVTLRGSPSHHRSVLLKLQLTALIGRHLLAAADNSSRLLLYLDIDIVCLGSLRDIIGHVEHAIQPKYPLAMVHAFGGPMLEFNTGVIVFDVVLRTKWEELARRQLLDGGHLGRSCRFKRPGRPCGGYSDQDLFNLLNRGPFAGQLIGRLPCTFNVQIIGLGELATCLQGSSPPIVLHAHQRRWKTLLGLPGNAGRRAETGGQMTEAERRAVQLWANATRGG